MTEKINELIESVKIIDLEHGIFDTSGKMTGTGIFEVVSKSDFDRVVEELTSPKIIDKGKIESAIRETLVVENKQSIHIAVEKIVQLIQNL